MGEIRLSAGQAGSRWREVASELRRAGATDLRKNLRKRVQDAGKPVLQEVQEAVRTLHVTSSHGGGQKQRQRYRANRARTEKTAARALSRSARLRDTVAKATTLQITNRGIRFVTRSGQLPENQRTLPRHLDNPKGWRHPVFGNREVWVSQKGGPWFASTIQRRAPEFRAAIVQAMEETRDAIK